MLLRRRTPRTHPIRIQRLEYFWVPIIIPFESLMWLSLESLLCYEYYYLSAFAKQYQPDRVVLLPIVVQPMAFVQEYV